MIVVVRHYKWAEVYIDPQRQKATTVVALRQLRFAVPVAFPFFYRSQTPFYLPKREVHELVYLVLLIPFSTDLEASAATNHHIFAPAVGRY